MEGISLDLQRSIGERYVVRSSMGCGSWARVPWIAVSDPSETTQHGLYIQILFAQDMSCVYVCLGQGTFRLKTAFGAETAMAHLSSVCELVRARVSALLPPDHPFDLSGGIDLKADRGGLAAEYERGAIVTLRLPAEDLPSEASMHATLHTLLEAYAALLDEPGYAELKVRVLLLLLVLVSLLLDE